MVAPVYATDLTTQSDADSAAGWTRIGTGNPISDTTFAIQGTQAIERTLNSGTSGAVHDNGSAIDLTGGNHIWVWAIMPAPGVADTLANGGVGISIGDGSANYVLFHVEGAETYKDSGRTGQCYPVSFVNTANVTAPYRSLVGSPTAAPNFAGAECTVSGKAKFAIDAVRVGTGGYTVDGEVADPATWSGFSTENSTSANTWGILIDLEGSLLLQGTFAIGRNSAGTAAACYFEEDNIDVKAVDTVHSSAGFTEIIVDHASTTWKQKNFNFKALGTNNRGKITVNSANPTVDLTGGTFEGIGLSVWRSNTTLTRRTFLKCDKVELIGAGSFDSCILEESDATIALAIEDLAYLTGGTFISAGTGHAVDLGTVASTVSMDWAADDSGYAATDGSTGNETILVSVNTGITLTINVATGASTPTIKNDGVGTVSVLVAPVTVGVTITDTDDVAIENARVEISATETVGTVTSGDVLLTGLTNASGILEDTSFTYESAFDPTGLDISIKARQGSVSPYKVPSTTTGTIVAGTGFSSVIALQPDE